MWAPLLAAALLSAALGSALTAAEHTREEREARAGEGFWVGGRYGRSPQALLAAGHRMRRLEGEVGDGETTNRFFMGSRYGKRAGERWKRHMCDCAAYDAFRRRNMRSAARGDTQHF